MLHFIWLISQLVLGFFTNYKLEFGMQLGEPKYFGWDSFCQFSALSTTRQQWGKGRGKYWMTFCRLIVGESLLLLVGEFTHFHREILRKIDKTSGGGGQNWMKHCGLNVGESWLWLVGESKQFIWKSSEKVAAFYSYPIGIKLQFLRSAT